MFPMSNRARSPLKRNAERKFPIRIRVKVPETGFGPKLADMHRWLNEECGSDGYVWASDSQPGHDATAIFLTDTETASRLVEAFGLELLFIEDVKLV